MQHIPGVQVAMAKMKVWHQLQVSRNKVEAAFQELVDREQVAPCGVHDDCWVLGG